MNLASPSVTATDLSGVNMTEVLHQINTANPPVDYIVVCLGEGTYAEKPGDIDDLALAAGQLEVRMEYMEYMCILCVYVLMQYIYLSTCGYVCIYSMWNNWPAPESR